MFNLKFIDTNKKLVTYKDRKGLYKSEIEYWKKIKGYENYSISTKGRIRNDKYNRILKQSIGLGGYYRVVLWKNNISKSMFVHKLVLETFVTKDKKNISNHIDNDKKNNNIENLEYAIPQEHQLHN